MSRLKYFLICGLLSFSSYAASKTQVRGRAASEALFFTEPSKMRHVRLLVDYKQTTELDPYVFFTTVDGGVRGDLISANQDWGQDLGIDSEVRRDEGLEWTLRQASLRYRWAKADVLVGMFQTDWLNTLGVETSALLTPMDLRFAGDLEPADQILAQGGMLLHSSLPLGSLDFLWVVAPKTHRFPAGDNLYGYYDELEDRSKPYTLRGVDDERSVRPLEGGEKHLRYTLDWPSWDLSLIAARHLQKFPVHRLVSESPDSLSIKRRQAMTTTYGISTSTSLGDDAFVGRFVYLLTPVRNPSFEAPMNVSQGERMQTLVLGLDYDFSRHFKVFSECSWSEIRANGTGDVETSKSYALRLQNETWDGVVLKLDARRADATGTGYSLIPQLSYEWSGAYTLGMGARKTFTNDQSGRLKYQKKSDHLMVSLERRFAVRD